MSTLSVLVPLVVNRARDLGIRTKLSSLRDAISFALVDLPYSQAVFSERSGRALSFDLPPPHLAATCVRYELDQAVFEDAFSGLQDYLQVEYLGCSIVDAKEVAQATLHAFGRPTLSISEFVEGLRVCRNARAQLRSDPVRALINDWLGGVYPPAADAFINRIAAELDSALARQAADMAAIQPEVTVTVSGGDTKPSLVAHLTVTRNGKRVTVDEQLVQKDGWALDQSASSRLHWNRPFTEEHPLSHLVTSTDGLPGPRAGLESAVRFIWRSSLLEVKRLAFNASAGLRDLPDELFEPYDSPCEGMDAAERLESTRYTYYPDHFMVVRDDPAWDKAVKSLAAAQHRHFEMRFINFFEFMLDHPAELGLDEFTGIEGLPAETIATDIAIHVESAFQSLHHHGGHTFDLSARQLPLRECDVACAELKDLRETVYVHFGKEASLESPFPGRPIEGCFVDKMEPGVISVVFVAPTRNALTHTGEARTISELIALDCVGSVCLMADTHGGAAGAMSVARALKTNAEDEDLIDGRWHPFLPRAIDALSQALRFIVDEPTPRGKRPKIEIEDEEYPSRCLVHAYR